MKERARKGYKKDTSYIGMSRERFDINAFKLVYQKQIEEFETTKTSDFYHYTRVPTIPDDERPSLEGIIATAFYYSAWTDISEFGSTQENLLEWGRAREKEEKSVEEQIFDGSMLLAKQNILIQAFGRVNQAKAVPFRGNNNLTSLQQVQYKNLCEEIGSNKPETFRETIRRYVPRWMWFPLTCSTEDTSSLKTGLLLSPENLEQDKLPIHTVFEVASKLEKSGFDEKAYDLKSQAVLSLLAMEKSKVNNGDNSEIPFFTYTLPALMTGEIRRPKTKPYFDHISAFRTLMTQTFDRFQEELSEEKAGSATNFLSQLEQSLPENFYKLFAYSILQHENTSGQFDAMSILHTMQEREYPQINKIIDYIHSLPVRKLVSNDEYTQMAELLPAPPSDSSSTPELGTLIGQILEDEDSYSFSYPFTKLGIARTAAAGSIDIDLYNEIETITANITYNGETFIRFIPLSLDFSGNIDDIKLDEETSKVYRDLISKAIFCELAKKQKMKNVDKAETKPVSIQSHNESARPKLTRDERKKIHAEINNAEQTKRKKIHKKDQQEIYLSENSAYEEQAKGRQRKIIGLDYETVESLLTLEKIEGLDASMVLQKIKHVEQVANINSKILGKKIEARIYKELTNSGRINEVNLRELKLILGDMVQLRVFLQDMGSGDFKLRGIMRKKSENQQTRFIRGIILDILKELD